MRYIYATHSTQGGIESLRADKVVYAWIHPSRAVRVVPISEDSLNWEIILSIIIRGGRENFRPSPPPSFCTHQLAMCWLHTSAGVKGLWCEETFVVNGIPAAERVNGAFCEDIFISLDETREAAG